MKSVLKYLSAIYFKSVVGIVCPSFVNSRKNFKHMDTKKMDSNTNIIVKFFSPNFGAESAAM